MLKPEPSRKLFFVKMLLMLAVLTPVFIGWASYTHAQTAAPTAMPAAGDETEAAMINPEGQAVAATAGTDADPDGTAAEAPAEPLGMGAANAIFLTGAALLVMFMQAGFALVECGLTRAKNACNIMMKNLLDFTFGALIFWAVGYSIMFGDNGNAYFGWDPNFLFLGEIGQSGDAAYQSAFWFFQVVFAATAATIVSGAMAERTKLIGYIAYSIMITLVIYPITGHWIWGPNGWFGSMNMRDFAGSTVVHSVGGWAALAGAICVGPRLGKYAADGTPRPIPGHNLVYVALGTFILWFGWYGFNPGSTLAAVEGVPYIAVTTTLAAGAGAIAALITTWVQFGKPDLSLTLNGVLAGLVGITAPCASVSTVGAVVIGLVAGVLVVESCLFVERVLKVDDPVGAISVHGVCGAWGTLSVGLFGIRAIDLPYWGDDTAIQNGLFYGGDATQFLIQLYGVGMAFALSFGVAMIIFTIIKFTIGLRVSDAEQIEGLDIGEHGNEAYAPDALAGDTFRPVPGSAAHAAELA